MTTLGWVFMCTFWGVIIALLLYTFSKLLSA